MNSKNGFFGLVPPVSAQKDAPTIAPAPAVAPEEAWPLMHNLSLDAEGVQKQLSDDEKKAAWRVSEDVASAEDASSQPPAPGKAELLADGLRQTRRSQRTKARAAAGPTPAGVDPATKPASVSADMSWPDQDIRVPIQGDAQVPVPPTVASSRPNAAPAVADASAMAAASADVGAASAAAAGPAEAVEPIPVLVPALAESPTAEVVIEDVVIEPDGPAAPEADLEVQLDAIESADVPVTTQPEPAAAMPLQAETPRAQPGADTEIRRFFARLRNEAGASAAEDADALVDLPMAPVRTGFLSGLGKK